MESQILAVVGYEVLHDAAGMGVVDTVRAENKSMAERSWPSRKIVLPQTDYDTSPARFGTAVSTSEPLPVRGLHPPAVHWCDSFSPVTLPSTRAVCLRTGPGSWISSCGTRMRCR